MFTYPLSGCYWNMHVQSGICNFQMNLVTKSSQSKSICSGSFTKKAKFCTPFSLKLHITTLKERIEFFFAKSVISNPHTEDLLPDFHNPIRL